MGTLGRSRSSERKVYISLDVFFRVFLHVSCVKVSSCVRTCVRACVRVCVCVCVCVCERERERVFERERVGYLGLEEEESLLVFVRSVFCFCYCIGVHEWVGRWLWSF